MPRDRLMPREGSISTAAVLAELREQLGALDAEFVRLLARRLDLARKAGVAKRAAGLATLDTQREAQVVAEVAGHARRLGLPEEAVRDIFWQVMAMSRAAQQADAR